MTKVKNIIGNLIAGVPIGIAQLVAFTIGVLSWIGSIFLSIGVETHKALRTPTGLKLLETEKMMKKVNDYIEKATKAQQAQTQGPASQQTSSSNKESMRLFNIVKDDNGGNGNESN